MANLLVTHTYVRVALIRLHANRDPSLPNQGDDLTAARQAVAVLDAVRLDDLPFLDPILGVSPCVLDPRQDELIILANRCSGHLYVRCLRVSPFTSTLTSFSHLILPLR